ncbi:PREDICTED: uncharacterized protein LOC109588138 [Amphimedon queenslandica]|uniref:Uncharacterized protein n=2 Tax=Amphimedon queenslandica TaxID=400682 RepID=A0AAN0JSM0_AMPQE|nr:PREDICTED: uncharacterized protein LOC109588138 [Amphimedon queenslandica]|eukprot:XP_019859879.1 PREDICTED: uncharacterized protein LOC109588138 [Amphimedon queenslandica]
MPEKCFTRICFPYLNAFMSIITIQWIKPKEQSSSDLPRYNSSFISDINESITKCFNRFYNAAECIVFFMTTVLSSQAVAINIFPLVMFIVGWATCKEGSTYEISDLCYTLYFNYTYSTSRNEFPELVLREHKPENDVNNSDTKHLIQEFVDLSKISLLFSTTANAVSHVLFIWALWCLYIKHYDSFNGCLLELMDDLKNHCCGVRHGKL